MLKNLKLGVKLFIGFGAIILIALFIGGMAILNMAKVTREAKTLSKEYVPEVKVANDVERNALLTMYSMRGYNYTSEQAFLDEGMKYLATVRQDLTDAAKLATDSKHLNQLKEAVQKVDTAVDEYEKLSNDAVLSNKRNEDLLNELGQIAVEVLQNCTDYLSSQNKLFAEDVAAGKKGAELTKRLKKIEMIHEIMVDCWQIRMTVWRAQAKRDPAIFQKETSLFDKIDKNVTDLLAITVQAVNINQLNIIGKSTKLYYEKSIALLDNWEKLDELNEKRSKSSQVVLDEAKSVALAGIDQTTTIADHTTSLLNRSSRTLLSGLCFSLLIGVFLSVVMTRIITGPIIKGVDFAQKVSEGDLNATIEVDQKDEIGQLARALQGMVEKLRIVVSEVAAAAENVTSGSQQLSASAQQMSQGASEQASAAEEASSSMEEMSSNIQANADNAQQTEKIALKASQDADESGRAVSNAVSAMSEIASKISIIVEIARQTDLLALNAAIEAARAGEHGKGFAVVADGVRKLAERSQQTAAEISDLAGSSVEVAQRAGEMLKQLVPDIKRTADLVQEINAASSEQNEGAMQINKAIQQLDEVIQQNASVSEEMSSTSEELASQAEQLQSAIEYFKISDSQKKTMRQQVHHVQQISHIKNVSGGTNGSKPKNNKKGVHIKLEHAVPVNDAKDSDFEKF